MKIKKQVIFILILLFSIPYSANAIDTISKQKYPFELLTDDYGILKEADLNTNNVGTYPAPFFPKKDEVSYVYWQCFPREDIFITLEDLGYTSEDIGGDENYGDLKITVYAQPNVTHEYVMRRTWAVSAFEERFNSWIKLMKGEKYVCLSGNFIQRQDKVEDGKKRQIHSWVFDRLKTKKGCDSYFDGDCKILSAVNTKN